MENESSTAEKNKKSSESEIYECSNNTREFKNEVSKCNSSSDVDWKKIIVAYEIRMSRESEKVAKSIGNLEE